MLFFYFSIIISFYFYLNKNNENIKVGDWGLGIGDWGSGIGSNQDSIMNNAQSALTNPHLSSHNEVNIYNKKK